MLVVVSIIILIAAAALPVVRQMTGSRSLEISSNIISAMLGRAHQQALNDVQYRGVFFYLDTATDRTAMVMIQREGEADPDAGFDAYKGWAGVAPDRSVAYYDANGAAPIQVPSYVTALVNTPGENKFIVSKFQCLQSNGSNGGNEPVAGGNTFWGTTGSLFIDAMPLSEVQYLPAGVGCQVITDPLGSPLTTGGAGACDRYMRTGAILFDATGRFDSEPWAIHANSALGHMLNIGSDLNISVSINQTAMPGLWSGFGLALYQRDAFSTGQILTGGVTTDKFSPSEGDWLLHDPQIPGPQAPASIADEAKEENWLDTNAMILWVDRSSGATIKGF
jgi:type II secretory pathway pseudopilin PulG